MKILSASPRELCLETDSAAAGRTVLVVLREELHLSPHRIASLKFRPDGIRVNGVRVRVDHVLQEGDVLTLKLKAESGTVLDPDGSSAPLEVLYEDNCLLIVNKPAGTPVHPSRGHYCDTLANQVSAYARARGENWGVRLIGRLDKDTSGCVLFAKSAEAAALLAPRQTMLQRRCAALACSAEMSQVQRVPACSAGTAQVQSASACSAGTAQEQSASACSAGTAQVPTVPNCAAGTDSTPAAPVCYRRAAQEPGVPGIAIRAAQAPSAPVAKHYTALVCGHILPAAGCIDRAVAPDRNCPGRMRAVPHPSREGKPARTTYHTLAAFTDCTLLSVAIEHGRTHQIRVHLASMGYPLVGDRLYGGSETLQAPQGMVSSFPDHVPVTAAPQETGLPLHNSSAEAQTPQRIFLPHPDSVAEVQTPQTGQDASLLAFTHAMLHCASLTVRQPFTGELITVDAPYPDDWTPFVTGRTCL